MIKLFSRQDTQTFVSGGLNIRAQNNLLPLSNIEQNNVDGVVQLSYSKIHHQNCTEGRFYPNNFFTSLSKDPSTELFVMRYQTP